MAVPATNQRHQCPRCQKVFRGPSFFQHVRNCKGKQLDLEGHLNEPVRHYTISAGILYSSSGKPLMENL